MAQTLQCLCVNYISCSNTDLLLLLLAWLAFSITYSDWYWTIAVWCLYHFNTIIHVVSCRTELCVRRVRSPSRELPLLYRFHLLWIRFWNRDRLDGVGTGWRWWLTLTFSKHIGFTRATGGGRRKRLAEVFITLVKFIICSCKKSPLIYLLLLLLKIKQLM